ncbi:mucin-4-like [Mobula hypostoma]|uniref:mucin-4-like n=1 Tax=Mobula hypostoma TaxID=723540 RepID=UPI002FC2ACBD
MTYKIQVIFFVKGWNELTRTLFVATDSDECSNGTHRCEQICIERNKFEDIRGYECDCTPGFMLNPDGESCTGTQLFDYGENFGDLKLHGEARDFNSPIINVSQGFPFGDAFYYRLYVYDFQVRKDTHSRTLQSELKKQVNEYYGSAEEISNFTPKWALKITWENVLPYNGYQNIDLEGTNTYQAVLLTDGIFSFCLIQFKEGGMNWKYDTIPYYRNYALMGYYSASLQSYLDSSKLQAFNDPHTRFNVPPEKIYRPDMYPGFQTEMEVDPYHSCCRDSGDDYYCALYRERRPLDFCAGYIPPQIGFFFGDPHVVTLDGVQYTFNGLGEFILLNVRDENDALTFSLQGRTIRAGENKTSQATVFVTLAAQGPTGTKVQWNLIEDDELSLMINGRTVNVTENSDIINKVAVHKTTKNETVATFQDGISITVSAKMGALSFTTSLDNSSKEKTEGLLGVWNDNKTDDFKAANGTYLKFDGTNLLNERVIFLNFGLTWKTTVNNSVFTYKAAIGESWYTYNNNSFIPKFYDELLQTSDKDKIDKANETCQGNDNCIFDVLSTNDLSFGTATLQSMNSFAAQNSTMKNFPPNITGTSRVQTRLNEPVHTLFTATDANNDAVTFSVLTDSPDIRITGKL